MKDFTSGNYIIINWKRRIIDKANWVSTKSMKEISKEMKLQEMVKKQKIAKAKM